MLRQSRLASFITSLLLLLRVFVPVVLAQGRQEWSGRTDDTTIQDSAGGRSSKTNDEGAYWSSLPDSSTPIKEMGDPTALEQQPSKFDLLKLPKYPQRPVSLDRVYSLLHRQQQQPRLKFQQNSYEIPVDYDDFAQRLPNSHTTSYYTDSYAPSQSSLVKAKIMPRESRLPRYMVMSNFKRARDGYMCHFKLCQVGVSGKRLSE